MNGPRRAAASGIFLGSHLVDGRMVTETGRAFTENGGRKKQTKQSGVFG